MAVSRTASGPGARGRQAKSPGGIPAKGWKDILYRTYQEVSNDRVMLIAAGVTFYLLLALAPTLAAFVSIYGLFFDPAAVQDQVASLSGVLPGGATDILGEQLNMLASADNQTLGFAFALSLGLALWSANSGVKTLFEAMNIAYDETEKRGFVKLTLVTLTFTICTLAAVIGLIAFNLAFSTFAEATGLTSLADWAVNLITAGIALLALVTFMAALYRFGPSRESAKWRWITPGAIIAAILIVVVSVAFSFYVGNFGTYNETYGSLGAVIGFLTWLWLTMIVLIMGGELNSEMEHQTARDTTTGRPRAMGARGANMADNLGPTYAQASDADGEAQLPGKGEEQGSHDRLPPARRGGATSIWTGQNAVVGAAFVIGALGLALARGGRGEAT